MNEEKTKRYNEVELMATNISHAIKEWCRGYQVAELESKLPPGRWETVKTWEERTGKKYPDDGPVWRRIITPGGHRTKWELLQYGAALVMSDWQENIVPRIGMGKPHEVING